MEQKLRTTPPETRFTGKAADKLEKERQRIMAAQQAMPEAEETDDKPTATEEPTATPDNDADPLKGIDFDDKQQVADALMEQSARIMNDKPEEETNMEQKKRQRGKAPKPVAQIDPETLKVIKVWPSRGEAERELGVYNIDRAISRCRMAGGFYWCAPEDAEGFKPNPLSGKTVPKHQVAATEQPSTPSTLADFTDDELMEELDRRGFEGELSRRVVFTIGAK